MVRKDKARSFSYVKLRRLITFKSFSEILELTTMIQTIASDNNDVLDC